MPTIRLRRNTSVQWLAINPILTSGEQGYETDTHRFKIGDGFARWTELDYFAPSADVLAAVEELIASTPPGDGVTQEQLSYHIDSLNPHPVYDDGPSLMLLYENAKV